MQCCYYRAEGKKRFLQQLLQVRYFSMLWIDGPNEMLIVEGRGEMAVMPAVTAVLLHHSALNTVAECSVVNTG